MKRLCIILISFLISFTACAQWGGGITQHNIPPSVPPQYGLKPSLFWYDSTQQALFVNNKTFGWWLLMSPYERYIRGMVNIGFANDQSINFSVIDNALRTQAGGNTAVMNGLYVVKFVTNSGNPSELGTVTDIPVLPVTFYITNNDYAIFRYFRNKLVNVQRFDDRSNSYFNSVETRISILRDSVRLLKDTAAVHRIEIDSLKNRTTSKEQTTLQLKVVTNGQYPHTRESAPIPKYLHGYKLKEIKMFWDTKSIASADCQILIEKTKYVAPSITLLNRSISPFETEPQFITVEPLNVPVSENDIIKVLITNIDSPRTTEYDRLYIVCVFEK